MSLDDMPAEPVADAQRAFKVDRITGNQRAEVGAAQRFRSRLEAQPAIALLDNRQANAIDRDAGAERGVRRDVRLRNGQPPAGTGRLDVRYETERFNETGKHGQRGKGNAEDRPRRMRFEEQYNAMAFVMGFT